MQDDFKYPRIKKIHQILEKITRIDQKVRILYVLLSHELYKKIYYISIYIFYILFISRQIQKSKNYENPTSTAKVIHRTSLNSWNNLLLHHIAFEFKMTCEA